MSFPDDPVGCVVCNQPVSYWAHLTGLIFCSDCFMNYGGPPEERVNRKSLVFAERYRGSHETITYRSFSCTPEEAQRRTQQCLDEYRDIPPKEPA